MYKSCQKLLTHCGERLRHSLYPAGCVAEPRERPAQESETPGIRLTLHSGAIDRARFTLNSLFQAR